MIENTPGYKIDEILFEGRRSIIYRCHHEKDDESVILKVLKNQSPSIEEIAHFKREYEILQSLKVDGVIRAKKLGTFNNCLMIVLEDFGGLSLKTLLSTIELDLKEFLQIAIRIVEILGDIHQQHIIHKDINPSNILWNPETDVVKIIDFGISTKLSREKPELHSAGVLEGALPYISPEQTGRMNRSIDYRTDYYSLGVTFYEMLTGCLPFYADDPMELVHCHIAKSPLPLHQFAPGSLTPSRLKRVGEKIPGVISDIVLKLMEKSPENRYQSTFGLKSDLKQCLVQQEEKGKIRGFEIRQNDIPYRFQVPQKLYGRTKEIETLLKVFEKVGSGQTEMMLVSGAPGVGKSVLVNEVHKPIVQKRGYFIEGKFDQFKRNVPYSALTQAFGQLVHQVLNEPEERVKLWQKQLNETLGPNSPLIIRIIPELEQIIGPQPLLLKELSPTEAQNRFIFTFGNFVKVFAKPEHPLTIFLDDLQWSDIPSLKLIEQLMTMKDVCNLFLIGAYRHNEVTKGHPLQLILDEIRKHKEVHQFFVRPLSRLSLSRLVADTLHSDPARSQPLTDIIYKKTEGNPFFSSELLKTLYRDQLIYFAAKKGAWEWDLEKIQEIEVSDNVVEFLVESLKILPVRTQVSLQMASCIGNTFDFKTLALIDEQAPEKTAEALWEAVEQGIIIPLNNEYRLLHSWKRNGGEFPDFEVYYQFQHDRLQQAAYSLIQEDKKQETHLEIGRLMLRHAGTEEQEEKVIDIVRHFNKGIPLIRDSAEREELVRLNLAAGKRAKASSAYLPALQYMGIARDLLPGDSWENHYSLTFEVLKGYCESAYLSGEFAEAEECCKILLDRADTRLKKAEIRAMQFAHYIFLGRMEEAIQIGILGLRQLGIKLPADPHTGTILKEILLTKWNLKRRTTARLLEQPEISDPAVKLCMKFLIYFISPSYLTGKTNLFALIVLKMTNLSLRYGNCPESAAAYAGYTIFLAGMGDPGAAHDFGNLAVKLNERFDDLEWRCKTYALYALFSHSWNRHWKGLSDWLKRAIEAGLQSGDFFYMAHSCVYVTLWDPVLDIDSAIKESEKYILLIEKSNQKETLDVAVLVRQRWLNFSGRTGDRLSFNDDSFDEDKYLERMNRVKYISGVAIYYIYKIHVCCLYEEYQAALKYVDEVDKVIKALIGSPYMEEFCLYTFLAAAACFPRMKGAEKRKARTRLTKEYKRMKKWSDHCPDNFLHHRWLMEAEMARLSGNYLDAVKYYNQAISAAEKNNFLRYKALTNELAARFFLEQGEEKVAAVYLTEAHYYYGGWGAAAKVKLLEEKYPSLFMKRSKQSLMDMSISSTTSVSSDSMSEGFLDLSTILKVSQTISKEINLSGLLKKITRLVIENAGAQKGFLILEKGNTWAIEAEGSAEGNVTSLTGSQSIDDSDRISKSVIHYAIRTKENVVLDNASNDEMFYGDPYIIKNQPKSILCSPMTIRGKISGIWYLENNLAVGAFTKERLKVLDMLSSQISISLVNARIYQELDDLNKNLELKVEERTRQLDNKNRQIMDSINYALNIQSSMLPKDERMRSYLSDYFMIWKPRDVVGGDFYWFEAFGDNFLIAVADCTGHGVPGALMTMTASSVLNRIVHSICRDEPARILKEFNRLMRASLNQDISSTLSDDGLDIGICYVMAKEREMIFAGAKIPLYYCTDNTLKVIRGDRQSIGYKRSKENFEYKSHTVEIKKNSVFFLATDGFIHQNGGEKDFSFGRKRFKEVLSINSNKPLREQKSILELRLKEYQGNELQRDDITVLGFKVRDTHEQVNGRS